MALSFAGPQRDYVEQVASALRARGVRSFYDADEQIDLWGRYLAEELPAIYGEHATAVVVFVSAEYAGPGLDPAGAPGRARPGGKGAPGRNRRPPGPMTRPCRACCRTWLRWTCATVPRAVRCRDRRQAGRLGRHCVGLG